MKKHTVLRRILASITAAATLITVLFIPVFADGIYTHLDGSKYVLEKVSNPDRLEGEIDGLLPGGDRASSYCWAMANNNGYLYIGTWANGLWQMVESISKAAENAGIEVTDELVDAIVDFAAHGEIDRCEDDSYYTAKIFRYCEETGEMELLFDPGEHKGDPDYGVVTGFRAAVEFKGDVYMDALLTGRCLLYRVDDEKPYDLPEVVFENTTLRAMCVSDDGETMFVGGSSPVPEGYLSSASIFLTTTGDSGDYQTIADAEDFAYYTKTGTTANFSDMITYPNDEYEAGYELFATLGTSKGMVIYRGHAASDEEIAAGLANKHGWVWTEFAGENGQYPTSLGNYLNINYNPVVFDGDLYFLTMTNPMTPLLQLFSGIVSGNTQQLYKGLDTVAKDCDNECSVYRLTKDGKLQMVMGDEEYCDESIEYVANLGAGFTNEKYGTTMYAWRGIEYNGRLYVNTIDYYNLFGYVTQLTNGDLLGLSKDDVKTNIGYAAALVKELTGSPSIMNILSSFSGIVEKVLTPELADSLENLVSSPMFDALYALYSGIDKTATTEFLSEMIDFSVKYADDMSAFCEKAVSMINSGVLADTAAAKQLAESINSIKNVFNMISENKEHIESYMIISETVANEKNPGGEVWCTSDGINWEPITRNGFNDKYNHGIRTFAIGDDGSLYYGCANPYYGAQLWKHTDVDDDYVYTGRQDPTQYEETESESGTGSSLSFIEKFFDFIKAFFEKLVVMFEDIFSSFGE